MKLKKILGLGLSAMLFLGAPVAAAPAEEHPPLMQLEKILKSDDIQSARNEFVLTATAPIGTALAQVDFTYVKNPWLKVEGSVDLAINPLMPMIPNFEYSLPFYGQESQKEMTLYFRPDEKWVKTVTKYDKKQQKERDGKTSDAYIDNALALLKEVEITYEDDQQKVFYILVDGDKFTQAVTVNIENQEKKPTQEDNKVIKAALDNWGDFDFTLTIDKPSGQVAGLHADLTEPCRRAAAAALAASDLKAADKLQYGAMLSAMTLVCDLTGDSFDQIEDVVIPKEVLKAKEEKTDKDKKNNKDSKDSKDKKDSHK